MIIDAYTKSLLALICICLVYLCFRDFLKVPKVHADEPMRVVLVDGSNHPVNSGGLPIIVTVIQ